MLGRELMSILQMNNKFERIIQTENVFLLGQIMISNDDYEICKKHFFASLVNHRCIVRPDLAISVFLVNCVIYAYKDGNFWDSIAVYLDCEKSEIAQTRANEIFMQTIRHYNLFALPDSGRNQSVENIKAHAYVANSYLDKYYDFVNAYYENVLFRQLEYSEIKEEMDDFKAYMKYSLENSENIVINLPGKASRPYGLLNCTKSVLAYGDNEFTLDLLYNSLKLIDDYYYDDVVPDKNDSDRFKSAFYEWCKKQNSSTRNSTRHRFRNLKSHNPYIKFNARNETFEIVIPAQKYRSVDCDGFMSIQIEFGEDENCAQSFTLDVYKQLGIFISEEKVFMIPSPFDRINIQFIGRDKSVVKTFSIDSSVCRIMDHRNVVIPRLVIGDNFVVVKHNEIISHNEKAITNIEYTESEFDIYTVTCKDGARIDIGYKSFRYSESDYIDYDFFERTENIYSNYYYFVTDPNDQTINVTLIHPVIYFSIEKTRLGGTAIFINSRRFLLDDLIKNYIQVVFTEQDQINECKTHVIIQLDRLFYSAIGYYEIYLDIPGNNQKTFVCKYVCFSRDFSVKKDKSIYYCSDTNEAKISFRTNINECVTIEPEYKVIDKIQNRTGDMEYTIYTFDCSQVDIAKYSFEMSDKKFFLNVPINKIMFGASPNKMEFRKTEYWYKDFPDVLYVRLPGASSAHLELNFDEFHCRAEGKLISDSLFRSEMSQINGIINDTTNKRNIYVDLFFKTYSEKKTTLRIQRLPIINPYFSDIGYDSLKKSMYININSIIGNAQVKAKIQNRKTKEIVFDSIIFEGKNYIQDLNTDCDYDIYPYMIEKKLFSTKRTELLPWGIKGQKDYSDITKCFIKIARIKNNGEKLDIGDYYLGIDHIENITEDVFRGRLFAASYKENKADFKNKSVIGYVRFDFSKVEKCFETYLSMWDNTEMDWAEIYYDKERKMLLSPNNKLLTSSDYHRFIPLFDDSATFLIKLTPKPRKEDNDDIQTN